MGDDIAALSPPELDEYFLRRSFEVARRAVTHGNHPFGAILVDRNHNVLIETEERLYAGPRRNRFTPNACLQRRPAPR